MVLPHWLTLFAFFFSVIATPSHARWAKITELPLLVEKEEYNITVGKDGRSDVIIATQTKIQAEAGRNQAGIRQITYNPNLTQITVLEAKTIRKDGKEIPVPPEKMEDKTVSNSGLTFDELRAVYVLFPQVEIGASTFLRYKYSQKTTMTGQYTFKQSFGDGHPDLAKAIHIQSEIPLQVHLNDPTHLIQVKEATDKLSSGGVKYLYSFETSAPISRVTVDEELPQINPQDIPHLLVTSNKSWKEIAQAFAPFYEEVLSSPLPPLLQAIKEKVAQKKSDSDRFNLVISELAQKITYIADFKTIKGRLIARPLATVADSLRGDCKDYSTAMVAILRSLGYTAHVALIYRGILRQDDPIELEPHHGAFNHAIVHVKTAKKEFWIDPTNFSAYSQGIQADIENRPALILARETEDLSRTEAIKSNTNSETIISHRYFNLLPTQNVKVSIDVTGIRAMPYVGLDQKSPSTAAVDRILLEGLVDLKKVDHWSIKRPPLVSRIVAPLHFSFDYDFDHIYKTSAGLSILLPGNPNQRIFVSHPEKRASDLYLGTPYRLTRENHLHSVEIIGKQSLDCAIESPWLNASRQIKHTDQTIVAIDKFDFKKEWIHLPELRSRSYQTLRQDLMKCFDSASLLFQPKEPPPETGNRVLAQVTVESPKTTPSSFAHSALLRILSCWK